MVKNLPILINKIINKQITMSFINSLEWRYATKKFDQTKKVSSEALEIIINAVRLAPTSFGLQALHLEVIENNSENTELLRALKTASWDQAQIDSCSHLLVFSTRTDFKQAIEEYFTFISGGNSEKREKLAVYEGMVLNSLPNMTIEWGKRQTYIALGFALAAAAELKIDSCPMEGFDAEKYQTLLSVPTNREISVIMPIGYRHNEEQPKPKARYSEKELITRK